MTKRAHPDLGGSDEEFREIHYAYRALLRQLRDPYGSSSDHGEFISSVDPLLADSAQADSFQSRRLLTGVAIAMALLVMVVMLLTPPILAQQ